jgi:hypothetical protein
MEMSREVNSKDLPIFRKGGEMSREADFPKKNWYSISRRKEKIHR